MFNVNGLCTAPCGWRLRFPWQKASPTVTVYGSPGGHHDGGSNARLLDETFLAQDRAYLNIHYMISTVF